MFVGHYGPSFAAKALKPAVPLWVLFLAVQLVDVLWAVFVLLGIEKVRIVPGITATNPLDLYYMPYTHGLIGSLVWAVAAAVLVRAVPRWNGWGAAAVVGGAVFSHWILDLVVHRPDLPLWDDAWKVGFGLWNLPVLAFLLEVLLLAVGMVLYLRGTRATSPLGRWGWPVFAIVMIAIQGSVFFGPPPPSDKAVAVMGLGSYLLFAGVAFWLEGKRRPARD